MIECMAEREKRREEEGERMEAGGARKGRDLAAGEPGWAGD
jgi:hypothetical protein